MHWENFCSFSKRACDVIGAADDALEVDDVSVDFALPMLATLLLGELPPQPASSAATATITTAPGTSRARIVR
jgi:hypothetical protein